MPSHPYEALSLRTLRLATIWTAVAWAVLTVVFVWAVPPARMAPMRELLASADPAASRALLASWPPSAVASSSFMLGFDFLYDLVHNNAVAFLAVWGAARCAGPRALLVGSITAWVLWLDTGLNVFENLALLHVIRAGEPEPLLPVAAAVFSFRSATLLFGLVVGVALHARARWGRQGAVRGDRTEGAR